MSMKMVILGLLLERNMHPYEIKLVMKERAMDQMMKLQMGSLYYAVDKLAGEGHIEAVEVIHSSDRPDKTIYRITDKGKTVFEQLVLQQVKKRSDLPSVLHHTCVLTAYRSEQGGKAPGRADSRNRTPGELCLSGL
ncbi:PadR family transcriptional regulator [Paenibacillus sonchi]|uniref:PadR family transcriptional regulator n=1 Tax=Paenibacillus sonchi TaxID=373687 RepID=UPI001F33BC62|nr:PadR family transcriptional regulator [Paenibacillus sonchi]